MILTSPRQLTEPPKRIISLVPSQTELLHWLGLEEETIGITKFCIHPAEWFKNKIRVGGTKSIDIQKIIEFNPDLIIANKEENSKEQIDVLAQSFNVWVTEVETLEQSLDMISDIGILTNRLSLSKELISKINISFQSIRSNSVSIPSTYLIWQNPYMSIGSDTFIHDMLAKAGFKNMFGNQLRYPEISLADIRKSDCRIVMLSSEPFPFKQKHIEELSEQLPGILIKLVDGEFFSWYGSRLLQAPTYFKTLREEVVRDLEG